MKEKKNEKFGLKKNPEVELNMNDLTNTKQTHIVSAITNPIRLPDYCIGIFSHCPTKSAIKKAIKKQNITVNGILASTATFIKGGETITLTIPKESPSWKKLTFPVDVLFEDEHLALINKPPGILVSGNSFKTIANALEQNLNKSILPDAVKPQPVHRLDYETTGILLIGKTNSSIRILNKMLEDKEVKKIYYTISIGGMPEYGQIDSRVDDKNALTDYSTVESVPSKRFGKLNLVKLKPKTGRRHQLRRHLSSIGNPILGDKEYGIDGLILKGKGLYLHAYSLEFIHPFTDEKIYIKADLPKKFNKIFTNSNG